ncbi:MAG: T9SS type A sorting domain-containing protein, partial [Bacteroidetes bacterium]|nr:T9SS type A sorting domain-containing protein [Bacteroidota bacterium]
ILAPPEGGAADWGGFAGLGRPTEGQQVGEGRWLISTGMSSGCPSNCGDYTSFVARSVEGRQNGWSLLYPDDFEIRFTAEGSLHYDRFGYVTGHEGGIVSGDDLPFELWNIGINTPDDPSDDYRMILAGLDQDVDGWGITQTDHEISSGNNDPETDWFYWFNPADTSPGRTGYDTWAAEALAIRNGENAFLGPEVLGRMVFVNWNGGNVESRVYDQYMPEEGTVFRLETPDELPVPLLASPGYGGQASSGSVSFYWSGIAHDVFRIQVARGRDFSSVVLDSVDVSPGMAWPFVDAGPYYWRVQSTTGVWSNIWPFEIVRGATGVSESDDNLLPTEFKLYENYPNPFNERTVITYDLPSASSVRLVVFDILGRRVSTLVDSRQAPGRYGQAFDAARLTSGVYFAGGREEGGEEGVGGGGGRGGERGERRRKRRRGPGGWGVLPIISRFLRVERILKDQPALRPFHGRFLRSTIRDRAISC